MNKEQLGAVLKQMADDGQPQENLDKIVAHYKQQQIDTSDPNHMHKNADGNWKTPEDIWQELQASKKEKGSQATDAPAEPQTVSTGTESTSDDGSSESQPPKFQPGQNHSGGDGYDYKYELDESGFPLYYTKRTGSDDWIEVDANANEEGNITNPAYISIGQELGHYGEEAFDKEAYFKAKQYETELKEREEDRKYRQENPSTIEDMNLTKAGDGDNVYIRGDHRIIYMDGKWYKQPLDPNQLDFGLQYDPSNLADFPGREMPQEFVDKINSVRSVGERASNGEEVSEVDLNDYLNISDVDMQQRSLDLTQDLKQFRKENSWTGGLSDEDVAEVKGLGVDDDIDYRNVKTWVKKDEELVRGMIENNFENVTVEERGIGNAVTVTGPDGTTYQVDLYSNYEENGINEFQRFVDDYDRLVKSGDIKYSVTSILSERRVSNSKMLSNDGLDAANKVFKEAGLDYSITKGGAVGYLINSPYGTHGVKDANEASAFIYKSLDNEDKDKLDKYNLDQRKNLINEISAKKKIKAEELNEEEVYKAYFKDGNVIDNMMFDLNNMPDYSGMTRKSKAIIKNHLEKPILEVKNEKDDESDMFGEAKIIQKEDWQEERFNTLKDLKDKLPEQDYNLLVNYLDSKKALEQTRLSNKKKQLIDSHGSLAAEVYLGKNIDVKLSSSDITNKTVNTLRRERQDLDTIGGDLIRSYKQDISVLNKRFDNINTMMKNAGCGVKVIGEGDDATVVVQHPDENVRLKYQKKLEDLMSQSKVINNGFDTAWGEYNTKNDSWIKAHADILGEEEKLNALVSKDYDKTKILWQDFFDGFRSFGYNIPAGFGSEEFQRRAQSKNAGKAYTMTKLTVDQASELGDQAFNVKRTMAQQGANTVIAISSSYLLPGSTFLGISASTWGTASAFGLSSFGGKKVELITRNEQAEKAEKTKIELKEAFDKGLITDYESYRDSMINLNKTISLGGLSRLQINSASGISGIVEGGTMLFLGEATNALKLKGLLGGQTSGAGSEMLKSGYRRLFDFTIGTGKMIGGEIVEELIVLGGDTLGDKIILGDDVDLNELGSEAKETIFSTVVSATPTSAFGNAVNQVRNHLGSSSDRSTWFNEVKPELFRIDEAMKALDPSDPKYDRKMKVLQNNYLGQIEKMANLSSEQAVNALALLDQFGAESAQDIIMNQNNLQDLYQQAGVDVGDSDAEIEQKLNDHMDGMDSEERANFKTNLDLTRKAIDVRDNVDYGNPKDATKYDVDKDGNVSGGFIWNTFGAKGLAKAEALSKKDPGFKDLSAKEQARQVFDAMQASDQAQAVREAKKDKKIVEDVEREVYKDKDGNGITKAEWLEQNNRKRVPSDLKAKEDSFFNMVANFVQSRKAEALVLKTKADVSTKAILQDKRLSDLTVEEANGSQDLELKIQQQVEQGNISQEKADQLIKGVKDGKVKAAIVGNQYITTEKEATEAAIESGDLLAGTAMSHEIGHFIDDTAMNAEERDGYANNLHDYISAEMPSIHDQVIKHNNKLSGDARYDESKNFEDQTSEAKDEYTKRAQDVLQFESNARHKQKIQNQSQTGFLNKMRGVVGGQFNINNANDAAAWMGSYLTGFENGEVGELQKRKLDNKKNQENVDSKGYRASSNLQERLDQNFGTDATSADAASLATDMLMRKPDGSPVDGTILESELAQNVGGLVESITKKLFDPIAPDARKGISRNEFKESVVTKAWEIMSKGYNPSKMSLDKYVSFLLNERSKDIARELGVESTTEYGGRGIDVNIDDAKGIESDFTAEDAFEQESEKITNPDLPLTENLDISEENSNVINETVNRAVGVELPAIDKQVSKNKFTTPFISALKKVFGTKNGPIHKAILNTIGKTKADVEAFLTDPKNKGSILRSAPTSWLAKNMPSAVQKSVGGTRVKNADGTTKFMPNWTSDWQGQKIDRWNANDVGPYRGNTSGPQVMRRHPAADSKVTNAEMLSNFAKGETMTDIRRNGLDKLSMMLGQEYGLEVFKNDLNNEGPISETFKGRQELFDRVLAENYVEEIGRQIERGTAKFSETGESSQNIVGDAIMFEVNDMLKDIASKYNKKTGGTTELDQMLEGRNPEAVAAFKTLGLYDMFGKTKRFMDTVKEMDWGDRYADQMSDYKENAHSKMPASHKESYNNLVLKMIDVCPPKLLDVLGYEFFGLNNHRMLDGAETKQDGSQGKYFPTRQKLQNKANQKGGELNLPFDPNGIEIMNSKKGLMNDVQSILNEDITADEKKKKLEKLQPRMDAANANNKKALAWMLGEMGKEVAKDKSLSLGLAVFQQTATNNVNGFRGLTDLGMIKVMDGSQAPYVTPNGKPTNSKTSKVKGELVANQVNRNHPDFQRAFEMAKGDEKKIGELLSNKGEHIDPSAPLQSKLLKNTLDLATRLAEARPEDQQQIINEFYADTQLELINFDQSLGPKIDSDTQDSRLGSTSQIGYSRNLAISPELKNYVDVKQGGDVVSLINQKATELTQRLGQEVRLNLQNMDKAKENVKLSEGESVGASVFDFDETLIDKGENTIIATKGDQTVTISSGDWPILGPQYAAQGFDFNFDDFINVRGGVEGPLMQKFRNQIAKYGTDNVFILTARPAEAAPAIQAWLDSQGISLPLKNITGLGDSRGDAKAQWFVDKYAEGYNDMYFVDDAKPNVDAVQHVFDQFDNKGKAVLVRNSESSANPSLDFNNILEEVTGVESFKEFSEAKARQRGKDKGRFRFFIPPSAEDFKGLLYNFLGKGKQGEAQFSFFKQELIDPYAKAQRQIDAAQQSINRDYKTIKKQHKPVIKKLRKKIPGTEFTYDQGVRIALWDRAGFDIPGLSPTDKNKVLAALGKEGDVVAYANDLSLITKQPDGYLAPGEFWVTETIGSDLNKLTQEVGREKYLEPFKQKRSQIFGDWQGKKLVGPNMNKIEAIYGTRFREALTDMLWRMENGTNRTFGDNRLVNSFANWINNSVGAIMFFNARSAALQTLSTVNFINFGNNNVFAAAKAFANQKQYWSDFSMLFNSDMLKQRRAGLKSDINQSEIAAAVEASGGNPKAALQYLLKIGFLPTQIADSFAIAAGGASFYRNQVKAYTKDGMSKADAEAQAMIDFQEIAEETQQSSRPDLISQQQASALGRFILAFQNTPMQYARLTKKAALDLINGRGDAKQHISRIIYYGAAQNIIFSSLQSAMFKFMYDEDEEAEDKAKARMANSVVDSFLRGTGVYGAIAATFKNMIIKFIEQDKRGGQMDQGRVLVEMLNLSPPVGSKARKLYSGLTTYKFNKEEMYEMDKLDIDNPMWQTVGNTVSAITNVPMDRAVNKVRNIKEALNQNNEAWQRVAMMMGWNTWDVGVKNQDLLESGKRIRDAKKEDKKRKRAEEVRKAEEERKKKEAAMTRCTAKTRKGKGPQCKNLTENKNGKCYAHQ
tara:strand:+ start:18924 stop:29153 length:10230 start_codon:yes stop_codon:yes gene_type:complete